MEETLKFKKREIPKIEQITSLYKQGFTIRSLSITFKVPYATLYRALTRYSSKNRAGYFSEAQEKWANKKKGNCYFCGNVKRNIKRNVKVYRINKIESVIHHIDYNQENNSKDNLIELCFSCHKRLHNIYNNLVKNDFLNFKKKVDKIKSKENG